MKTTSASRPIIRSRKPAAPAILLMAALAGCGDSAPIICDAPTFLEHVSVLAADSMLGREPGTAANRTAASYIARRFSAGGLEPGFGDSWLQEVPLRRSVVRESSARVIGEGEARALDPGAIALRTESLDPTVTVAAPLWFAGYAIAAPDRGHGELSAEGLAGSVWIALEGLPEDPSGLPGGELSRHGRLETKLAAARRNGARGVLFVTTEDGLASRRAGNDAGHVSLEDPTGPALELVGWMGPAAFDQLLEETGLTRDEVDRRIAAPAFQAFDTGLTLDADLSQEVARFTSPNVVARLPGDPGDESVLLMAHYDGLGIGAPNEMGDSIYNGALDNAAGTAGLICIARALAGQRGQRRELVFFATTAEEGGALGAAHYARNPATPLERTVASLNIDGINVHWASDDYFVMPAGEVELGPIAATAAEQQGTAFREAPGWAAAGMHYSFDTHRLNARGVPAITVWQGRSGFGGRTPDEISARFGLFSGRHHGPDDELTDEWLPEGIEQHLRLYESLTRQLALGAPPLLLRADHAFHPVETP